MKKHLLLVSLTFVLGACTHGNCRTKQNAERNNANTAGDLAGVTAATTTSSSKTPEEEAAMNPSPKTERVKVHKPDGSLQCGQGKAIPLSEMQKQLKNIKVYSSENKNDGMMRIQVCGSPTGNSNVYEIDRKDLEAALKAGFTEWTVD